MTLRAMKVKENQRERDLRLTTEIKVKLRMLRTAIREAQDAGLKVEIPVLLYLYLTHDIPSGSFGTWTVRRGATDEQSASEEVK
jgi:hypothetical protein